uniref:Low density lipoprotein receptor adapter protein 1 n=1 Tax=Canis lupus familiaris TaxID=9615 RepID=A0A8C0PLN2_CANLF
MRGWGEGGKERASRALDLTLGAPFVGPPRGARAEARTGRGGARPPGAGPGRGGGGAWAGAGPVRPSPRPVGRRRGARAAGGGARSPRAARPRRKVFPDGVLAAAAGAAMDALKSAGRALIRSPSLAKQSWGGGGRHRKLPENWTDTRETLLEGMLFSLKYLGMTLVEQPKGEELSAAAVKRIVATAKASGKKLQKVTLKVSPRGIILTDNITNQLIENVSIYRISYCTADKMHDKVFAYIAQSQHNENLECHAFLCTKRKMAQAVTLTVAQAFKVAFEFWQVSKEEKEKREKASQEGGDLLGGGLRDSTPSLKSLVATGNLLDLEETAKAPLSTVSANTTKVDEAPRPQALNNSSVVWELDDGLDEAFSRLAQSRTNPQVLDIGLTAQDIHYAQCLSPVDWDKPDSSSTEQDDLFSF